MAKIKELYDDIRVNDLVTARDILKDTGTNSFVRVKDTVVDIVDFINEMNDAAFENLEALAEANIFVALACAQWLRLEPEAAYFLDQQIHP